MISVPYEVKKALRDGMLRKNYRFVVLNDDGSEDFTIDNDNLVSESVSIDERMCSGDTLKFGLCEGSSLEFQYFMPEKGQYEANKTYMRNDLVHSNGVAWRSRIDNNTGNPLVEGDYWAEWVKPNITGRRVQVFVDVEYEKVITEYVWETQASFNNYYTISGMSGECRLYSSLSNAWNYVYVRENGVETQVYPTPSETGTIIELGDVTGRTLMVNLDVMPAPSAQLQLLIPHTGPRILTYSIPMGFFDVKKCSRQASTGIIKVTAYNKLQSDYLDAKANELIDEAYASIDRTYTPSPTIDDVLRYVLSDFAIVQSVPKALTESSSASVYQIVKEPTFPPILEARYAGIATFTTVEKLPTYCEWLPNPASAYVNYFYVDGGVQIVVSGLNALKEYVRTHDCAVTGLGNASHFKISCTYGFDGSDNNWATYEQVISLDDDVDRVVTPYFRNYYVSRGGPTPGTKYEASFTIEIPMDKDTSTADAVVETLNSLLQNVTCEFLYTSPSAIGSIEITDYSVWPDITLRELQSSIYETNCQFGQLSRITDLFTGVDLNYGGLYPAEDLYPANDLYPGGAVMSANKAMYSQLWADEGNVHRWRNLVITYKGLDEEQNEVDIVHERVIDANGTDDYNMSDNWLFRNLIWTEEQIDDYADAMIAKMQDVTWFPFEMWCAGLPYLETGDQIEIPLNGEVYTSYVLQRQLKGIQNLQDTYINGTLDIF